MTKKPLAKRLTLTYIVDTRRYLLLAILAAIVTVGLLYVLIFSQAESVWQLSQKQSEETKKLASLQAKVVQLRSVSQPAVAEQIELVNQLLPTKKPLVELLNSLSVIANNNQLSLSELQLSPGTLSTDSATVAKEALNKGELDLKFTTTGSLAQLNVLFNQLEQTTPLITIRQLSLRPNDQTFSVNSSTISDTQIYRAEVTLVAGYFPQSVAAQLEADLPEITDSQEKILANLAAFTVILPPSQLQIMGGGLEDLFGIGIPELDQK